MPRHDDPAGGLWIPLMLIVAVSLGCGPSIPGSPYRPRIKLCTPAGKLHRGFCFIAFPIDRQRFRVYIPYRGIVHVG